MRENIGLFRGKRIDNGEWVEGYYYYLSGVRQHKITAIESFVSYTVDPDTVGECTGLKDKNGKLIFEGDVLKKLFENRYTQRLVVGYSIKEFCWMVTNWYGIPERLRNVIGELEILGNIHDNPELLKGGEGDDG